MGKKDRRYRRLFPERPRKPISLKVADAAVAAIWEEHDRRRSRKFLDDDGADTKAESANYFLMREIYALGLAVMHSPPSWKMETLLEKVRDLRFSTRTPMNNTFHVLLMSVWESDVQVSRQRRWNMAKEMEYAHRHSIPPNLLCGFLLQTGSNKKVLKKLQDDYVEPSFRSLPEDDEED